MSKSVAFMAAEKSISKILVERGRQDAKWGEQNHDAETWALILLEEIGEWAKAELELKFTGGPGASEMEKAVEGEAVQVAAVAMAMVECQERKKLMARKET